MAITLNYVRFWSKANIQLLPRMRVLGGWRREYRTVDLCLRLAHKLAQRELKKAHKLAQLEVQLERQLKLKASIEKMLSKLNAERQQLIDAGLDQPET